MTFWFQSLIFRMLPSCLIQFLGTFFSDFLIEIFTRLCAYTVIFSWRKRRIKINMLHLVNLSYFKCWTSLKGNRKSIFFPANWTRTVAKPTLEQFWLENAGVFTQTTHLMFSFHATHEKFENVTVTGRFGFTVFEKTHVYMVTSAFSKNSVFLTG